MTSLQLWRQRLADRSQALAELEALIENREPHLQALVEEPGRFDRLRQQIETCPPGKLQQVPFGVKDIFQVDGLETRAGSRLPTAELAGGEAACVTTLKQAGGVVLGKTVTTEFAYFAPGATRNPHDSGHTPGGSSSGSAAAVAAGYCPVALGTQTIASISRPAAFCGVVGCKPSYGRIPLAGVLPLAPSLDHVGFFTSSAADAALVASILVDDWRPTEQLATRPRLGIADGPYLDRAKPAGRSHFERLRRHLEDSGWQLVPVAMFEDFDRVEATHQRILAAEAARVHRRWFSRFADLYHPRTRELIERGESISDRELSADRQEIPRLRRSIEATMSREGIDLWITPAATGPAPEGLESTGDPVMSLPWTQAGLPSLSLPAGTDANGLPLGLQLVARFGADEDLLLRGIELEAALGSLP